MQEKEIIEEVKKRLRDPKNNTEDFLVIPKHIKITKRTIFLIPAIIFIFLLVNNFLISNQFNYFYNIGENNENYLRPSNRVSEPLADELDTYRNLTESLVYFDSLIPRGSNEVKIDLKFRGNAKNLQLNLGARDQEQWHYYWKTFYNPSLNLISSLETSSGVYRINESLPILSKSELLKTPGITIGVTENTISKESVVTDFSETETIINNSLRGGHTFYIYLKDNLYLGLEKQDLNWYNGSDELEVSLYNSEGKLISKVTFPDDGITSVNKGESKVIEGILTAKNLKEGVYKLELSDFDGLIRSLSFNTNKVVIADKVYIADSDIFFNGLEKPTILYTNLSRNSEISIKTWHNQGLQQVKLTYKNLDINQTSNATIQPLEKGEYYIYSPKNDLIIEIPGYFSFSKESYFEPFVNNIVKVKNDPEWIYSNLDYIITDYSPPEEGNWSIAHISFNLKNLYIKDNKLSLVINSPQLSSEDSEKSQISINWINITVYKRGIFY